MIKKSVFGKECMFWQKREREKQGQAVSKKEIRKGKTITETEINLNQERSDSRRTIKR